MRFPLGSIGRTVTSSFNAAIMLLLYSAWSLTSSVASECGSIFAIVKFPFPFNIVSVSRVNSKASASVKSSGRLPFHKGVPSMSYLLGITPPSTSGHFVPYAQFPSFRLSQRGSGLSSSANISLSSCRRQ